MAAIYFYSKSAAFFIHDNRKSVFDFSIISANIKHSKNKLQALEQAKRRVANEKKKQNEKKRKAEKPLPHKPLSPMSKMKAGAVWNGEGNGKSG